MTDHEKADALLGLVEGQMRHLHQTRDIEMKVNLSLWTLIVLVGYFLLQANVRIAGAGLLAFGVAAVMLVLGHWLLWMRPIQASEDADAHGIALYRAEVERLVGIAAPTWGEADTGSQWIAFVVGMTAALLVGVGLLLLARLV